MSENQEFRQYYRLSSEDKRTYNRWLWVNAVFAVIVFTGRPCHGRGGRMGSKERPNASGKRNRPSLERGANGLTRQPEDFGGLRFARVD